MRRSPPVQRRGLSSGSRSLSEALLDTKDMAVLGRSSNAMSGEQSCSSIIDLLYAALCGVDGASKVMIAPLRVDWVLSARTMINRRFGAGLDGAVFWIIPWSQR